MVDEMAKNTIFRLLAFNMVIAASLFLAGGAGELPAEEWNRTYEGTANSAQQTSDGGYIVVGDASESDSYSFNWDEIPGNDNGRLIEFLTNYLGIDSVKTANIEKIDDGTIKVSTEKYFLSLKLNNEKSKVNLTIDDGINYITYEFIAKAENGKLKIYSESYSNSNVKMIKTDANGNLQWSTKYGGSESDIGNAVQQTKDGGYIIAGDTTSYGAGHNDAWIIKTDTNGKELWSKTFGGNNDDYAYSIQQTPDDGYIIGCVAYSYSGAWLIKTDARGKELWNKKFEGRLNSDSVKFTTDGGYIIAGNSNPPGGGLNAWLIKTDAIGNNLWNITFAGPNFSEFFSVQQTSDGGYIVAGHKAPNNSPLVAWLVKLDKHGNLQWDKTYDRMDGGAKSVQQTVDGGYIFAGTVTLEGNDLGDAWLVKTDANGSELWSKSFGEAEEDEMFRSVRQTSDGGYILAGGTWGTRSTTTPKTNFWLVKVGEIKVKQEYSKTLENITRTPTTTQPQEILGFEALLSLLIILIVYRIKRKAT